MTKAQNAIRLVLFDIDCTLTEGEATALDLDLFAQLAAMNQAARSDPTHPAVTLCTGRQPAYVEALLQAIDGHVPAIYENGSGLYTPVTHEFIPHPLVGDGATFEAAKQRLAAALVCSGRAFFQIGKAHSLSIFARDEADKPKLYEWACEALGPLQETVDMAYAASCLNVMPRGVNKGAGLEMLCDLTGYSAENILGVGDSDNDLEFLAKVGYSAAPANANARVRGLVGYVSPFETGQGARDILHHFGVARGL